MSKLLRNLASVGSMSDLEISSEIRSIETEDGIIRRRLAAIDDGAEGLPFEEIELRDNLFNRWHAINDRYTELCDERSRRLWVNVEATAAQREAEARQARRAQAAAHGPFGRRI